MMLAASAIGLGSMAHGRPQTKADRFRRGLLYLLNGPASDILNTVDVTTPVNQEVYS
jgi:hypothetical protein